MADLRRALLINTGERYINFAVNFALMVIVSRIVEPRDFGVVAIGTALLALAECVRDVPTNFLVQKPQVDDEDVRTAFTVMLGLSVLCALFLLGCGVIGSRHYGDHGLIVYFSILAAALLPGPFERPLMALMRRDLRFAPLAIVNISVVTVSALVTVSLAMLGWRYHAFAIALLLGNLTAFVMSFWYCPSHKMFRLDVSRWRQAVTTGAYSAGIGICGKILEMTPYLLVGRSGRLDDAGFLNRAIALGSLPDKMFVSGLAPVAFPALTARVRDGRDIKEFFLHGVALVSVIQVPAYLMLAVLAYPVTTFVLGPKWIDVAPLLQIFSCAGALALTHGFTTPTFMALGAFRSLFLITVALLPIHFLITFVTASVSLHWLAWGFVLRCAITESLSLFVFRRFVPVSISELCAALWRSGVVTALTLALPLVFVMWRGGPVEIPFGPAIVAGLLGAAGWIAGVLIVSHPIVREFEILRGKSAVHS